MAWRFKLRHTYVLKRPEFEGKYFKSQWCKMENGELTIRPQYCWDGCSPAIPLPFGFWAGTPDGSLCDDGRPQAYYASLVHDVFCQYHETIPLTKEEVSTIFYDMLRFRGFSPFRAAVYKFAVTTFGPQSWGV